MKPRTCDRALPTVKLENSGRGSRVAAVGGRCVVRGYGTLCLIACLLWAFCACPRVSAENHPESSVAVEARNTTMARALFDEGLKYVDSEQWEQAQDRFGRVLSLRYSAVAAYNWGLALARLGRGVVAASALRRLLTDVNLDPHVHEHASSLLREVEARFAWLNVRVQGECTGCAVSLNEQVWPWAAIGVFVPVDAGSYALRLRLGDNVLAEQRLTIAATERVEATLASGHPANATKDATSNPANPMLMAQPRPAAQPAQDSVLKSPWFWGAIGVIAIGVGGVIVLASQ